MDGGSRAGHRRARQRTLPRAGVGGERRAGPVSSRAASLSGAAGIDGRGAGSVGPRLSGLRRVAGGFRAGTGDPGAQRARTLSPVRYIMPCLLVETRERRFTVWLDNVTVLKKMGETDVM